MYTLISRRLSLVPALIAAALALAPPARAQSPAPAPSQPPQQAAPFDLTGYWVAVVTEDWRWRMLTPPKGDYASVPISPEGKKIADGWSEAEDGSCKAYGAGGVMRMPTRLHISWASPTVLRIETDWGEQTRSFHFDRNELSAAGGASLQGHSLAAWERPIAINAAGAAGGFGAQSPSMPGGYLKVVTTDLSPGWLRRNGVPYSEQTRVTEYYQTFTDALGRQWFDVTTQVDDPRYLQRPFITSSDFRREPDGSKWAPHPCRSG